MLDLIFYLVLQNFYYQREKMVPKYKKASMVYLKRECLNNTLGNVLEKYFSELLSRKFIDSF